MNRRQFIKNTGKIAAGGLMASSIGCEKLSDIMSSGDVVTLKNGKTWGGFQMAVDIFSEGFYDTTYAYTPCVIKDDGIYKMWYSGSNGNHRIIYCESTNGINWLNFKMVVDRNILGTYDTNEVFLPCVIKDGGIYKMWYTGDDGTRRILYCESTNGINWSNFQLVVNTNSEGAYDIVGCEYPCIIKDGGIYKMWYGGNDGILRILYCESTNGINWSNFQLVVNTSSEGTYDTGFVTNPRVIKDGNIYKMWYEGFSGASRMIYCESTNGINWTNFQLAVNISSEGVYDINQSLGASVINDGGIGKMWYSGQDGGFNYRIIYCESR